MPELVHAASVSCVLKYTQGHVSHNATCLQKCQEAAPELNGSVLSVATAKPANHREFNNFDRDRGGGGYGRGGSDRFGARGAMGRRMGGRGGGYGYDDGYGGYDDGYGGYDRGGRDRDFDRGYDRRGPMRERDRMGGPGMGVMGPETGFFGPGMMPAMTSPFMMGMGGMGAMGAMGMGGMGAMGMMQQQQQGEAGGGQGMGGSGGGSRASTGGYGAGRSNQSAGGGGNSAARGGYGGNATGGYGQSYY